MIENFGEEIFFQHTWLRHILIDCLCKIGGGSGGTYTKNSLEFARSIAHDLKRTSKDFVENIADIFSKVKIRAGKLGDFGINLEKELRDLSDVEALQYHVLSLADEGAKFVVLIDDLDLGWDNSAGANNLLLGLLSACNYLSSLNNNIFCCIFLREDVYSILITKTQHSDKYRNIERIRWKKEDLLEVINNRINFNRRKHGMHTVDDPFSTVFPATIGTSNTDNWLIDRTLSRPRELIQFARYYTENVESETPEVSILKECETAYSSWKLDDLCSEYSNQYPGLIAIFSFWKTNFFRYKYHLKRAEIEEMLLAIASEVDLNENWFNEIVSNTDLEKFLKILYEIGFIGDFILGGEGGSKAFYSYDERHEPLFKEVQIHPCFRKSVNTVDRIKSSS